MKRIVSLILIVFLLTASLPMAAAAPLDGSCAENLIWMLEDSGTLTIFGQGPMKPEGEAPWRHVYDEILTVKVEEGVTSVSADAFAHCPALTQLYLPATMEEIDETAFRGAPVTDVYYYGNAEQFARIPGSRSFLQAQIHYMPWVYLNCGDGYHTRESYCDCCGLWTQGILIPCSDENGDYFCDFCGAELCAHSDMNVVYDDLGGKQHEVRMSCGTCGLLMGTVTEPCMDYNGDAMCELCLGLLCVHMRFSTSYIPSGDRMHSLATVCLDCGGVVEQQIQICVDADFNLRCDYCGAASCTHSKIEYTYKPGENRTHLVSSVCADCGKKQTDYTSACVDLDGDDHCQFCGSYLCPHKELDVTYEGQGDLTHKKRSVCPCGQWEKTETQTCTDLDENGLCDLCKSTMTQLPKLTVVGANMTLGNDLKMNFLIKKEDCKDGYVAKVTQTGREPVELELWSYNDNYYAASYSVAAKEMTDVLSCEIYDAEGDLVSNPFTRTIRQYAMTLLNNASQKASLKSVIVDMLNYGTEAQKYFHYNEDAYANADVTEAQQAEFATKDVTCVNNQVKGEKFAGANLSLEDSILLNVFFSEVYADDLTATVTFTDYLGNEVNAEGEVSKYNASLTKVVVNQVVLADAKRPVTVTLYKDGTEIGSGIESVESYIARNIDNASTGAINMAIMKFAASAYRYLGGTN